MQVKCVSGFLNTFQVGYTNNYWDLIRCFQTSFIFPSTPETGANSVHYTSTSITSPSRWKTPTSSQAPAKAQPHPEQSPPSY